MKIAPKNEEQEKMGGGGGEETGRRRGEEMGRGGEEMGRRGGGSSQIHIRTILYPQRGKTFYPPRRKGQLPESEEYVP